MTPIFFFALYLLVGLGIGVKLDAWEMRKEIPYGHAPSGIPLASVRKFCIAASMLVWPGYPYQWGRAIVRVYWKQLRVIRRARRRFRKVRL